MRRRDAIDLAVVLGIALLVRLWGFRWGLPGAAGDMTAIRKAWDFWRWGTGAGPDMNPHDFGWPSLLFYLVFIQQALALAWGRVTGAWPTSADFRLMYELDPAPLIALGRAFSTAADLGVVALTWFVGRSLHGRTAATIAALFIALDVHHVAWSQNVGPEVWVALFVLLGTSRLLGIASGGRRRDYLLFGVFTGLGIATKYTPVLLFAALPLAHRLAPAASRRARHLAAAGGAAFAAFFIASPFVILDPGESFFYIFSQSHRLAAVPHFGQESLGPGWLFYLRNSLPESLGWPWLLAGLAGCAAAMRHPLRREALPCVFPVLYFVIFGAGTSKYDHYMLPVTPFLAMAGAGLVVRLARRLAPGSAEGKPAGAPGGNGRTGAGGIPRALPWMAAGIALVFPAISMARHHESVTRPDSRRAAREWIEHNIPAGALIVTEFAGPDLMSAARLDAIRHDAAMRDIAPRLLERLATRPSYAIATLPLYAQEPEESAPFYDLALYDGFQYCIVSSEVSSRYRSDPSRFRAQNDFYRQLDALGPPVEVFGGAPRTGGPEIRVYSIRDATPRMAASAATRPEFLLTRAADRIRDYARLRSERAVDFAKRLGDALDAGGEPSRAARAWVLALEFAPRDVDLHHALGEALSRLGRDDLARREYQQVLALDPDHIGALNNLGGIDLREGRIAEARRLLERALSLAPDFADAHANLGWVLWLEDHDLPAARSHFLEAIRLAPAHPGAARLRMAVDEIDRGGAPPVSRPSPER